MISYNPDDYSLNVLLIDSNQWLRISSSAGESAIAPRLSLAWGKDKSKGKQTGIKNRAISSPQPGCCSPPPLSIGLNSIQTVLLPMAGQPRGSFQSPLLTCLLEGPCCVTFYIPNPETGRAGLVYILRRK